MAKYILLFVSTILFVLLAVTAQESDLDNMDSDDFKSMSEKVFCTKEYSPVCASDGKTYGNKCEFENAKRIKQDLTSRNGACDE